MLDLIFELVNNVANISSKINLFKKLPFFFTFLGLCNSRTEFFHERLTLDDRGYLGLGVRNPAEPVHVRSSGNAIRFDVKSRPNSAKNTADILISKYI